MSNREEMISKYIDDLKKHVGADTDADLARLLSLDKRTVSAWRRRKSAPERFLRLLLGKGDVPDLARSQRCHRRIGTPFRGPYSDTLAWMGDFAKAGDYRDVWAEFSTSLTFWVLMVDARSDLVQALRQRADHPATALALVLHDDVSDPDATMQRDGAAVAKVRPVAGGEKAD